ncbi:hypothetical protein B566_EDAN006515 [Ephemera danica]|nr:hypothetical protein B566_EDAN006515 [Ephemera danica]
MERKACHYLLLYVISALIAKHGIFGACGNGETETFERVTGQVPATTEEILLLSRNPDTEPLASECANICLNQTDVCRNFVVDYVQNACFRVTIPTDGNDIFGFTPTDLFQAHSVDFYHKICIRAPKTCGQLTWLIERAPGFELRTGHAVVRTDVPDRLSCAAKCLNEASFQCRSAQYDPLSKRCRLSSEDRRTVPGAFVPALGTAEYLENQCTQFQHTQSQVCSYEEFRESTLNQTDVKVMGVRYHQCRQLCDLERRFRCRGFTFVVSASDVVIIQASSCLLHSADITSAGPNALVALPGALYSERAPCLDLLLRCSKKEMTMKLRTVDPFYGRIFVRGQANKCDTLGTGKNETILVVRPSCAAFTEDGVNAGIVVQYNAIIQRRGDRALNVTCSYSSHMQAAVNSSIEVSGDPFLGGAVSVNSSDVTSATVRIVITDRQGREASITEVGRDLELRIIAVNTESVLLLDERGCPPDPATFPALQKMEGSHDLVAYFRAFRFTSSTVVDCGPAGESYGRRRRDDAAVTAEGNSLAWSLVPANNKTAQVQAATAGFPSEMPLEMDLFVLPDTLHPVIKIQSNASGTYAPDDNIVFVALAVAVWTAARVFANTPRPAAASVKLRNVKWQGSREAFG